MDTRATLRKLWSETFCLADFSWIERIFFLLIFFFSLGFSYGGAKFSKSGIPLQFGTSLGSISNFQPALFPMEILLGVLVITVAFTFRKLPVMNRFTPMLWTILIVLLVGTARLSMDISLNPLLALRNSAFFWYLSLPLLILLLPVRSAVIFRAINAHLLLVGIILFCVILESMLLGKPVGYQWFTEIGIAFLVYVFLVTDQKILAALGLLLLSMNFGFSYELKFQRTVLLGAALTPPILWWVTKNKFQLLPVYWKRLAYLIPGFLLGIGVLMFAPQYKGGATSIFNSRPFFKSEVNEYGIEIFRLHMWKQAWAKVVDQPITGIGFIDTVVDSVYLGHGQSKENFGNYPLLPDQSPIAGPHNSYLNALARMGVTGILFIFLHAMAALVLVRRGMFLPLFLLMGQVVYAFFNVGLEGPVRSFHILVVLALALKCEAEDAPLGQKLSSFFSNISSRIVSKTSSP